MRCLLAMSVLAALLCGACDDKKEDPGAESSTAGLMAAGQEALLRGQADRAIEKYKQAIVKEPKLALLHNLMGMAYRFKQAQQPGPEWKKAEIAAFTQAVDLDPKFVDARVNLGSAYYHTGDKRAAAEQFEQVLELMPGHPETELLKGMILEGKPVAEDKD